MKPGDIVKNHSHENMNEIFYVVIGKGTIRINEIVHDLIPDQYISIPPGSKTFQIAKIDVHCLLFCDTIYNIIKRICFLKYYTIYDLI